MTLAVGTSPGPDTRRTRYIGRDWPVARGLIGGVLADAMAGDPARARAGLSGYRVVNTIDAMVGHHPPRYERFGQSSARLDDVANWIPARVTALLAAACFAAVGGTPGITWPTSRDYGPLHPSPDAGWYEAAFAAALGVQLGGTLSYSGRSEHRPEMGNGRAPQTAGIRRANRLSRAVTASATILSASLVAASAPTTTHSFRRDQGAYDADAAVTNR